MARSIKGKHMDARMQGGTKVVMMKASSSRGHAVMMATTLKSCDSTKVW